MSTIELIKQHKFIAIFRHIPKDRARDAARAVFGGGVRLFEITFDPSSSTTAEDTAEIIRAIKDELGDEISVGAGTVISLEFAKAAYDAGAEFIVSPCTKPEIIKYTKENGMVSIPGAYTPTEIMNAYDLGADIVKIFPVLPSESAYLKNVMSPLSHIPFIPTGGINPDTIEEFMSTGAVAVAAGASILTKALVESGDFKTVTENARKHIEKLK